MIREMKEKRKEGGTILSVVVALALTLLLASITVNMSKNSVDSRNVVREMTAFDQVVQSTVARAYEVADEENAWRDLELKGFEGYTSYDIPELIPSAYEDDNRFLFAESSDLPAFKTFQVTNNGRVYIDFEYLPSESNAVAYDVDVLNIYFNYKYYEPGHPTEEAIRTNFSFKNKKDLVTRGGHEVFVYRLERSAADVE